MASRRRWYRFFRAITLLTFIGMALGAGILGGLFASVSKVLPKGEALGDIRPPAPTRVLACDGSLLAKVYSENREIVPFNRMKFMPNATLAIEDIRFMDHPGVDPRGILRALVKNIVARNSKEGASTITQQLARNLYLSREKKITRKLQEMILALELERRYSKQEILETYLNQVYYGANRYGVQSYGVQMAAQNYFGKNVDQLTLAECALLAGLPKNPRDYNPYRYPEAARRRRELVLSNMLSYNLINQEQFDEANNAPIKLVPEKKLQEMADFHAPYFVRQILTVELKKIFGQDTNELTYHYGINIFTTLEPRMQKVAEETVEAQVRENKFRRIDDGALISIDPQTGGIKAMVGGTNYRKDQYNIVTQGHRQPGSSFKPFVYTTALLRGYTPETIVHDSPGRYPSGAGGIWSPKNSDGRYRGAMQLQQALWLSRNAAAVSVASDIKIQNVIKVAYRMGIKYPLEAYLPTAIGSSVVVPMEICSAYGTLANHGVYNEPYGIARVTTSDGDVLYEHRLRPRRAIPENIANTMQTMMRGVIERGTARAARCPFPASGKTGTTNSFRDAWFIGYTDDLVTAVWVGNRHNQSMNRTFGGTVPAPIWHDYMIVAQPIMLSEHKKVHTYLTNTNNIPDKNDLDLRPSEYVVKHGQDSYRRSRRNRDRVSDADIGAPTKAVTNSPPPSARDREVRILCSESHLLATSACPSTIAVTYVRGKPPHPPIRTCTIHRSTPIATAHGGGTRKHRSVHDATIGPSHGILISICTETGKIATNNCPHVVRRRFSPDQAPSETCPLHGD